MPSLASAQQSTTLQQQLDQLKQQYKQTTEQMQQRISALEQQIQQQEQKAAKEKVEKEKENTVSSAELATQQEAKKIISGESKQVGAKFQGQLAQAPTYDLLQEADTKIKGLERQVGNFEFHGYFRSRTISRRTDRHGLPPARDERRCRSTGPAN